ncbi:MAG: hypothetical protein QME81_00340 [bacterium]|nr:hypothetical protein [bacterium]
MLPSVKGRFEVGQIILNEVLNLKQAEVIVTFLLPESSEDVDMPSLGISKSMAAEARYQMSGFEEDWNAPGMDAYDKL